MSYVRYIVVNGRWVPAPISINWDQPQRPVRIIEPPQRPTGAGLQPLSRPVDINWTPARREPALAVPPSGTYGRQPSFVTQPFTRSVIHGWTPPARQTF